MKRNIYKELLRWKKDNNKKPLMISGQRQIGKTYIVKLFANIEYKNHIYINFMKSPNFKRIFDNSLDPKDIFKNISLIENKHIDKNTLIIFDEIQECPQAIIFLKFLNESNFKNNLISTGSWIDAAIKKEKISYPVGQIKHIKMFPMTIDEFIMAIKEYPLILEIEQAFKEKRMINELVHNKLLSIYDDYLSIGGMPEIIKMYISKKSFDEIDNTLSNLNNGYIGDLSKYATNINIIKTNAIYDSLANNLNRDYNKFKYSLIEKNSQFRDWSESIDLLNITKVTIPAYMIKKPDISLEGNYNSNFFKLYFSDIGLLINKANISRSELNRGSFTFLGWISENYVAIHLQSSYLKLFYWYKQPFEIDFVIKNGDFIMPIDVKSGRKKRSSSLKHYIDKYKPQKSIIVSRDNFSFGEKIINIPLYAVYKIKDIK